MFISALYIARSHVLSEYRAFVAFLVTAPSVDLATKVNWYDPTAYAFIWAGGYCCIITAQSGVGAVCYLNSVPHHSFKVRLQIDHLAPGQCQVSIAITEIPMEEIRPIVATANASYRHRCRGGLRCCCMWYFNFPWFSHQHFAGDRAIRWCRNSIFCLGVGCNSVWVMVPLFSLSASGI